MKMTLTTEELEHAIACYLRANAAVEVGEITFSLKRTGIETVVETTVKEARDPEEVVQGLKKPDIIPIAQNSHIPLSQLPFGNQEEPKVFTANPEELIDDNQKEMVNEIPEEIEPEQETESVEESPEEQGRRLMREVIEEEEGVSPALTFDDEIEKSVEEMPVHNTMSISDILGS